MAVTAEQFEAVAKLVGDKNTPTARESTRGEKLRLYGLYKRATVQSSDMPARPGVFKIEARSKWDAWKAEEGLSVEEARQAYVDLAKELVGKPVEDALAS